MVEFLFPQLFIADDGARARNRLARTVPAAFEREGSATGAGDDGERGKTALQDRTLYDFLRDENTIVLYSVVIRELSKRRVVSEGVSIPSLSGFGSKSFARRQRWRARVCNLFIISMSVCRAAFSRTRSETVRY